MIVIFVFIFFTKIAAWMQKKYFWIVYLVFFFACLLYGKSVDIKRKYIRAQRLIFII